LKLHRVKRGLCRMCARRIIEGGRINRRKHWHLECVRTYLIAKQPRVARAQLYLRDRGVCASCGTDTTVEWRERWGGKAERLGWRTDEEWVRLNQTQIVDYGMPGEWEADHIIPLVHAPRELRYWGLENLQTLCRPCHRMKTTVDMRLHRSGTRIRKRVA
jgi:5-methylcytosine-specific restriction endonuclease McrA